MEEQIEQSIQYLLRIVSQYLEYQHTWEKDERLIEAFKEKFNELYSKNQEDLPDSQNRFHAIDPVFIIALYQIFEGENLTLDEFEQHAMSIYEWYMDPMIQRMISSLRDNSDPWKFFVEGTVPVIKASYGDLFKLDILQADDKACAFDLHRCLYYEIFQKNGFPELCPIRCAYDWVTTKSIDKWVKFERDKTIANRIVDVHFVIILKSNSFFSRTFRIASLREVPSVIVGLS